MAFPADYRRVQMAGGIETDVDVHVGLPKQLIVDTTNLNIRLMDGATQGGHRVQMEKDLGKSLLDEAFSGEPLYIALGTDAGFGNAEIRSRLWKASALKNFFSKFLNITLTNNNTDYTLSLLDSALRANLRTTAALITNLDEATTTGVHRFVPASTLNMPANYPTNTGAQGFLYTMAQSTNELYQLLYIRDGTNRVWARMRNAGVFSEWNLASGITESDLNAYLKINGTVAMTGKLHLKTPTADAAPLRMISGAQPNTPLDGDIWRSDENGGLRYRKSGATLTIIDNSYYGTTNDILAGNARLAGTNIITPVISIGINQTWQVLTGARAPGQAYQNNAGRPICVHCYTNYNVGTFQVSPDGSNWITIATSSSSDSLDCHVIVPAGWWYRKQAASAFVQWTELR